MADRQIPDGGPVQVAVVGGGSIGVAFAVVFARASFSVCLTDPDPQRREAVPSEARDRLDRWSRAGLVTEPVEQVAARIRVEGELGEAVASAKLVQECVPERLEIKQGLFSELARLTGPDCILASSSSAIPSSQSAHGSEAAHRSLVAHPGNPPLLIPVIELVPSPQTDPDVLHRAQELYSRAGLSPILVQKEVEGFVFNRLQGAVLREAYALVRDGVATVEDIDTVMRDGLGRRWAFMGPFETVDLNTRGGIASHAEKMGPAYERMGAERGQHDPWTPELVTEVTRQRREVLPLDQWEQRVAWRDDQLLRRS